MEQNDDSRVLKSWIAEDNIRWKFEEKEEIGYQTGREDGIIEGLAEGRIEGLAAGKETATIEMIKKLLNQNVDYTIISTASGKTIEEIQEIEKNNISEEKDSMN